MIKRFLFELHSTTQALKTRTHSFLWTLIRKPYPYEHLRRTEHLLDLEIPEVTIGASLVVDKNTVITT
jgi:hypothetical protein